MLNVIDVLLFVCVFVVQFSLMSWCDMWFGQWLVISRCFFFGCSGNLGSSVCVVMLFVIIMCFVCSMLLFVSVMFGLLIVMVCLWCIVMCGVCCSSQFVVMGVQRIVLFGIFSVLLRFVCSIGFSCVSVVVLISLLVMLCVVSVVCFVCVRFILCVLVVSYSVLQLWYVQLLGILLFNVCYNLIE